MKAAAPSKTAAKKSSTVKKSASSKSPKKRAPTWRNRQTTPAPDRYREIQEALAAKGFLDPDSATGEWGPASVDALKRFQAAQKLDVTGKINSLSLIALGLGPKREAPQKSPDPTPEPPVIRP